VRCPWLWGAALLLASGCGGSSVARDDAETTDSWGDDVAEAGPDERADAADSADAEDAGAESSPACDASVPEAPVCAVDEDGDRFGEGCAAGPDCDDAEPLCTSDCSDGDGDGTPECLDPRWLAALEPYRTLYLDGAVGLRDGGVAAFASIVSDEWGSQEPWVARFADDGRLLWQRMSLVASGAGWLQRLIQLRDGTLLAGGGACSTGTPTGCGPLLLSFALDGTPRWVENFALGENDYDIGLAELAGGDLIVVSWRNEPVGGYGDIDLPWMARLRPDGTPVWQRLLRLSGSARPADVAATADGGSIVVGRASADGAAGGDGSGIWAARFGGDGLPSWQRVYRSDVDDGVVLRVRQLRDGSFLLASNSYPSRQLLIVRLAPSGDHVSTRAFAIPAVEPPYFGEVSVAPTRNGFLVAGSVTASGRLFGWLAAIDADSGLAWSRVFDTESGGGVPSEAPDGRIVLVGWLSVASIGPAAEFPASCDPLGEFAGVFELPAPCWTVDDVTASIEDTDLAINRWVQHTTEPAVAAAAICP
jgi:hypothetical protein